MPSLHVQVAAGLSGHSRPRAGWHQDEDTRGDPELCRGWVQAQASLMAATVGGAPPLT